MEVPRNGISLLEYAGWRNNIPTRIPYSSRLINGRIEEGSIVLPPLLFERASKLINYPTMEFEGLF